MRISAFGFSKQYCDIQMINRTEDIVNTFRKTMQKRSHNYKDIIQIAFIISIFPYEYANSRKFDGRVFAFIHNTI